MIEVYLSFNGNAREAVAYYAQVFEADAPSIMYYSQMPADENAVIPKGSEDLVMHAAVTTFAGTLMMSDNEPGVITIPNPSVVLTLSHEDPDRLRRLFSALAKDGEVIMPLAETFFSPLYGQVKDRYGFYWNIMVWQET